MTQSDHNKQCLLNTNQVFAACFTFNSAVYLNETGSERRMTLRQKDSLNLFF
jgi:hypothetical protein